MIDRIEKILKKVRALKDSNATLQNKVNEFQSLAIQKDEQISNLQRQLAVEAKASEDAMIVLRKKLEDLIFEKENLENKLNFYNLAPENLSKKELKDKIDSYIQQIDNCIKVLDSI
jgi:predicted  nucleic acid-binding Zn-ribbon protein